MARVLFIGGTGQISLPCVERAIAQGHDVSVFNRGRADANLPAGVNSIIGDFTDDTAYAALADHNFDVVCQFIIFTPEQMARDIRTFAGHAGHYIFISSASVYEKLPSHYVITEETPAVNPFWKYSQDKIACEDLMRASSGLNWTIIRPSHTVRSGLPTLVHEGDTLADRILAGKPILVSGDGSAPWTLTRCSDFAVPFVGLFGRTETLGETYHITNDTAFTWDTIYGAIAAHLGAEAKIVHVPSDTLVRYCPEWTGALIGDKTWTALFDNSKIKAVVGNFTCSHDISEILSEPVAHYKKRRAARGGPAAYAHDALMDRIAAEQSALGR